MFSQKLPKVKDIVKRPTSTQMFYSRTLLKHKIVFRIVILLSETYSNDVHGYSADDASSNRLIRHVCFMYEVKC